MSTYLKVDDPRNAGSLSFPRARPVTIRWYPGGKATGKRKQSGQRNNQGMGWMGWGMGMGRKASQSQLGPGTAPDVTCMHSFKLGL
jgi:hypothetical protein